jgi:hypothetical protein
VLRSERNKWEEIKDSGAYIGDLKDPFGRRVLMIITDGVAVFAKCMIENFYIMKDDFEKILTDFDFVLAARLENGIPFFSNEIEVAFDEEILEE